MATLFTHPILRCSGLPLINAGAGCPPTDQLGALRNGACDKGAIEFNGLLPRLRLPLIRR